MWGVNADQVVYFRLNTFGDPDDEGTGWIRVEGRFQTIYSGPKAVLALAGNRDIYYRANLVRGPETMFIPFCIQKRTAFTFTEIGKKAWLLAKLQPGRAIKRIIATY